MFDVVQSSWTSTTYLPTWQMDMDWMQPGNNSNIHPTRRRFYISLRKSDRKKEKNEKKKKQSAKKKSSNPQRFHRYGLVYHSRFGRTEYSHPNSIVLIQEKKAPPGLSRERDDVREKRVRGEQCNCSDNKRRTRRRRRRTRNWRRKRRKESLIERYLNRI